MAKKKKSKNKNKSANVRTDRGTKGGSSITGSGTPRTSKKSKPTTSSSKKKTSSSSKGSKNTRKEGDRIKSELKLREQKGKDKAKQIKDKKIEGRPKNIGRTGERGEDKRKTAQKRNNKLLSNKNKKNDPLKKQELVNARRFWDLQDQYKKGMDKLGNVSAINKRLDKSLQELKLRNKKDRAAFNNESLKNQKLITSMEKSSANQIATMERRAADDRELYQAQLAGLNDMYSGQNALVAEQQRLQQIQERKARNLQNAYVPEREDSLASVRYGDNRKKRRKAKDNRLSDLRINTGLQSAVANASAAVAGLQLA